MGRGLPNLYQCTKLVATVCLSFTTWWAWLPELLGILMWNFVVKKKNCCYKTFPPSLFDISSIVIYQWCMKQGIPFRTLGWVMNHGTSSRHRKCSLSQVEAALSHSLWSVHLHLMFVESKEILWSGESTELYTVIYRAPGAMVNLRLVNFQN